MTTVERSSAFASIASAPLSSTHDGLGYMLRYRPYLYRFFDNLTGPTTPFMHSGACGVRATCMDLSLTQLVVRTLWWPSIRQLEFSTTVKTARAPTQETSTETFLPKVSVGSVCLRVFFTWFSRRNQLKTLPNTKV